MKQTKNILIILIFLAIGLLTVIFFLKNEDTSSLIRDIPVVPDNTKIVEDIQQKVPDDKIISKTENPDVIFIKGVETEDINLTSFSPEEGIKTGLTQYPLLTWETHQIDGSNERESIKATYPHFLGSSRFYNLNKYIDTLIQDIIEKDREIVKDILKKYPNDQSYESMVLLSSTYRLIDITNGIVSLELITTDFTGGGNGNHNESITINWDLKSDKLLTADQIFCSENYEKSLLRLVQKGVFKTLYPSSIWAEKWSTPEKYNWENFLLKNDGIIAVFQPYSVASGAFGIIRMLIPNTEIPNVLCLP